MGEVEAGPEGAEVPARALRLLYLLALLMIHLVESNSVRLAPKTLEKTPLGVTDVNTGYVLQKCAMLSYKEN